MFSKKQFAIVSNLRFIRRTNFMLSWVEHEKKFYNLGARAIPYILYYPKDLYKHVWAHSADLKEQFDLALHGLSFCQYF